MFNTVQYSTILTIVYNTLQYNTVLYRILYYIVLYSTWGGEREEGLGEGRGDCGREACSAFGGGGGVGNKVSF